MHLGRHKRSHHSSFSTVMGRREHLFPQDPAGACKSEAQPTGTQEEDLWSQVCEDF